MLTTFLLLAALVIGFGAAFQTSLLGAMGRMRGPAEASWLSILATGCAVAVILAARAFRGDAPALPSPLDRPWPYVLVAAASLLGIVLTVRGVAPYFAITGLFGLAFIFGAAAIAPRIGIALFLSATIAGQLIGALVLDQIGPFGAIAVPLTAQRALGAAMLLGGVALVRGLGR